MSTLVLNDPGGNIGEHITNALSLAQSGTFLLVKYCASACMLIIASVPQDNICFYPDAWIGHHTAAQHVNDQGICCVESPTTMRWERGRDWIARGYRSCMKR